MVNRVPYMPESPPNVDMGEVFKYLGYGKNPPDDETVRKVKECSEKLRAAVVPRCVYAAFPIKTDGGIPALEGCSLTLAGNDISAHLKGCDTAVLMAVTLSEHADRLIRRCRAEDLMLGLIMECCADAAVEDLCDRAENEIKSRFKGKFFRARYSPGYGDFPLTAQEEFLRVLDAQRIIGLCATGSSILTPRKSVTAVIGAGGSPAAETGTRCDGCPIRTNCRFLKRGERCGL